MKARNFKTKVIGPILLLIPMACMHMGDNHHSGDHHSSTSQPSYQSSIYAQAAEGIIGQGLVTIHQDNEEEK